MSSSLIKFWAPDTLALAGSGRITAPTSAQAPVASIFLRETVIFIIVHSPFHNVDWASVQFPYGLPDPEHGVEFGQCSGPEQEIFRPLWVVQPAPEEAVKSFVIPGKQLLECCA